MEIKSDKVVSSEPKRFVLQKCNVDHYETLYTKSYSDIIYKTIINVLPKPLPKGKRINVTYGDEGLVYEVVFGGYGGKPRNVVQRHAIAWNKLPILEELRDHISMLTGEKYNYCVIQYYPCGKVGIKPHKDKEMILGTTICGLSIGETRVLQLSPPKFLNEESISLSLSTGSLYVLKPPTNSYWTHAILTDKTTNPRISLTFRNVENK